MIHVGDNTWNLRIFITDLQVEKTLRVRGDLHIGGLMLKLVDPGLYLSLYLYLCLCCLPFNHRAIRFEILFIFVFT